MRMSVWPLQTTCPASQSALFEGEAAGACCVGGDWLSATVVILSGAFDEGLSASGGTKSTRKELF